MKLKPKPTTPQNSNPHYLTVKEFIEVISLTESVNNIEATTQQPADSDDISNSKIVEELDDTTINDILKDMRPSQRHKLLEKIKSAESLKIILTTEEKEQLKQSKDKKDPDIVELSKEAESFEE